MCKGRVGPRSYEVAVGAIIYRRNRQHVMITKEEYQMDEYNDISVDDRTQHQVLPDDNSAASETLSQQDIKHLG